LRFRNNLINRETSMTSEKIIVVAAVNGGMQMSHGGAHVPITPDEIAEDALQCYEAGAAILHVHARDAEGRNSGDPKIYAEIIRKVRARCPILVQTTNGIGIRRNPKTGELVWPTDEERLATDFFHPAGGYLEETPYVNSLHFLKTTLPHVFAMGSTIEFELTDINVTNRLSRLADEGIFNRNASNLWMLHAAGLGNKPPNARNLVYSTDEMRRHFPNAKWGVMGGGHFHYTYSAIGIGMGCDSVRVGFEDSMFLPDGRIAARNRNHVEAIVRLARCIGRETASVDETRTIFELSSGRS
jgi:3-keto-5-aminohexanoate cleavage enzyme